MRLERIIIVLVALMLLVGWTLWAVSEGGLLARVSAFLWIAAFVTLCAPLLLWVLDKALRRQKDQ